MTAKELLLKNECNPRYHFDLVSYSDVTEEDLIEFAKYHVEQALKEALDNIPSLGSSTDIPSYEEVEEAVLNAYSLENIK